MSAVRLYVLLTFTQGISEKMDPKVAGSVSTQSHTQHTDAHYHADTRMLLHT